MNAGSDTENPAAALADCERMANDTFESEEVALNWLHRPHPMLEGKSPLEYAKTPSDVQRVKDILVAIKYGGGV